MPKVKLATVWFSGCSGCHMSLLDLDEALVDLAGRIELWNSPLTDLKDFPEAGVDVTLVEGAVANEQQREHAHRVREKSRIVIALGDCAVTGNVPGMRNGIPTDRLVERLYGKARTSNGAIPCGEVPALLARVSPLHEEIRVDLYLHGCPPPAALIGKAILALLEGLSPVLVGQDLKFG
ncbi:MAG: NADP oxidoreductase [Candidatus Bipolaricaulota bacterium]|nr:NADP oxidoreductase [Candidatus Bipolaricaulota bacterium]